MKSPKILLDIDEDSVPLKLGLLRLTKDIPAHELFYHLNLINDITFERIGDLKFARTYSDYFFPRYQGFHRESKVCIQFIANRASHQEPKKVSAELFGDDEAAAFLIPHSPDAEYLLKTSDPIPDFSVISLPENLVFPLQNILVSSSDELYHLIQYYE